MNICGCIPRVKQMLVKIKNNDFTCVQLEWNGYYQVAKMKWPRKEALLLNMPRRGKKIFFGEDCKLFTTFYYGLLTHSTHHSSRDKRSDKIIRPKVKMRLFF